MKTEMHTLIQSLKEEIQIKSGKKITCTSDCAYLSEQILNTTKRQISVSTLKRFFCIIQSTFNPSKYTLDTLAVFLHFCNWQDFINSFEEEEHKYSHQESWDSLKDRTNIITNASLKSIKNKIGVNYEKIPIRRFAEKKLKNFYVHQKLHQLLLHLKVLGNQQLSPNFVKNILLVKILFSPTTLLASLMGVSCINYLPITKK